MHTVLNVKHDVTATNRYVALEHRNLETVTRSTVIENDRPELPSVANLNEAPCTERDGYKKLRLHDLCSLVNQQRAEAELSNEIVTCSGASAADNVD